MSAGFSSATSHGKEGDSVGDIRMGDIAQVDNIPHLWMEQVKHSLHNLATAI